MLIDHSVLHFCARVTRRIAADYDRYCVFPEEQATGGFPRSADAMGEMIEGAMDKKIVYRRLKIHASETRIRGFCIPYDNHYEIYFVAGLDLNYMRYLKVKELLQIHLYEESTRTIDIVELVHNQILRASPESRDLNRSRNNVRCLGRTRSRGVPFSL